MPVEFSSSVNAFRGMDIAILPFPTLGDTTAYLHLAQSLADAGTHVSTYSEILAPVANLLPWLTIAVPSKSEYWWCVRQPRACNRRHSLPSDRSPDNAFCGQKSLLRHCKGDAQGLHPAPVQKMLQGLNSTAAIQFIAHFALEQDTDNRWSPGSTNTRQRHYAYLLSLLQNSTLARSDG